MIIASLEIISWQFQIVLKFSILNAKVLATMLPLFSIVSAFATRLLPIVCNKRVVSACRFGKIPSKSWIFIKNIFKPFEKRLRKSIISAQLDLCEKALLILNFISEIKMELLLPISRRTTWSSSDIYNNKWAIDISNF